VVRFRDSNGPIDYRFVMTFDEICVLAASRKREMPAGSTTAALFEQGAHGIGKKLVEEAAESWMAARFESREVLAGELSQVLYYVACMMAEKGLAPEDVYRSL
jgi:phosphoribosyl-ATP pyrophosphohydrolase